MVTYFDEPMRMCIVCGYQIPDDFPQDRLTCGDRCLNELKNRQVIAKDHRREMQKSKQKNYRSMADTICTIVENFARVLLEQDIPYYTSNIDIEREICKHDEWFKKLNQGYRRRCLTKTAGSVGYIVHSTGNRGKKTYKLVEDRKVLREKLVSLSMRAEMVK